MHRFGRALITTAFASMISGGTASADDNPPAPAPSPDAPPAAPSPDPAPAAPSPDPAPPAPDEHPIATTGRVIDNLGRPIAGATVTVEGSTDHVTTDKGGRFKLVA